MRWTSKTRKGYPEKPDTLTSVKEKYFFWFISPKGGKQVLTEQKRRRIYQECYQAIALRSVRVGNRVGKIGGSYGSSKEVQDPVSRSLFTVKQNESA